MALCPNCIVAEPVISTILKKNQAPIYDTLGPFPDETILSTLDRLLYFIGVRKAQKCFDLPPPSCRSSSDSDCSIVIRYPDRRGRTRCITKCPSGDAGVRKRSRSRTPCPSTASKKSSCCVAKICCPAKKNDRPSVTIDDCCSLCGDDTIPKKFCTHMKRSYSLCSLACRKLRNMMTFSSASKEAPTWLWTHMQTCSNGTRILKIYENPGTGEPPNIRCSQPKMIFVVLPNGSIVPFESIRPHV